MRDHIVRYADPEPRYGLLARDGCIRPLAGSPFESMETSGPATHVERVRLLAPVRPRSLTVLDSIIWAMRRRWGLHRRPTRCCS